MSLWPLFTVAPCLNYLDAGSCVPPPGPKVPSIFGAYLWFHGAYNPYLLTCPRHYDYTILGADHFFYDAGSDTLVLQSRLALSVWIGWMVKPYHFNASDGVLLGEDAFEPTGGVSGLFGPIYSRSAAVGSYSKIYAPYYGTGNANDNYIREINIDNMEPIVNGWKVNPYTWNPSRLYSFAIVNREDNILVGGTGNTLDCWRNINTAPEIFAKLTVPGIISYVAYESRKYLWVITTDGIILKANYQIPRWEMVSTVQNPTEDTLRYLITFDTKRHRVVVFRWRADAVDGASRNQIEFYFPMVLPAILTQPVPVTSLKSGKRIFLVSNLIGNAGEGLTPYTVNGVMKAPVEGYLITPFSGTELNGRVSFQYQPPRSACEETLQLSVIVEES